MKIGFSNFEIPGKIGFQLGGYAERQGGNDGILDPVLFNVVYIEDGDKTLVICSGDIIAVNSKLTRYVRKKVSEKIDINPKSIMICASHTHSSYAYVRADAESPLKKIVMDPDLSQEEYEYFDLMASSLVDAIIYASENMQESSIKYGQARIEGLASNRNDKNLYFDDRVYVIAIEDSQKNLVGLIVTATCHPTILSYKSNKVSADFPGQMRKILDSKYPGVRSIFLQGPAGEVSSRFIRQGQDYDEVIRMGQILASKICEILDDKMIELNLNSVKNTDITLYRRMYESDESIFKKIEQYKSIIKNYSENNPEYRKAVVNLEGAKINKFFKDNIQFDSINTCIQTVDFGEVKLVTIPGEPFGSIAQALYRELGPNTIIVGYTNDYIGYIVGKSDFDRDIYEKEMMVVSQESEQIIQNAIIENFT